MWRLRNKLFSHIIEQEVGFFDRVRTGELMNRLSEVGVSLPLPLYEPLFIRYLYNSATTGMLLPLLSLVLHN